MAWKQSKERNRRIRNLYVHKGWPYVGIFYNEEKGRYIRKYYGSRYWKKYSNRKVRRYRGEFPNHKGYRKIHDYQWTIV